MTETAHRNTGCAQCGTIGPFHIKPKCPMCGHINVTTEQMHQALRDLDAAQEEGNDLEALAADIRDRAAQGEYGPTAQRLANEEHAMLALIEAAADPVGAIYDNQGEGPDLISVSLTGTSVAITCHQEPALISPDDARELAAMLKEAADSIEPP